MELMITLVVGAILITLAAPSFEHVIMTSRIGTAANAVVDALDTAKMQAIRSGDEVQFCGSSGNGGDALGNACAGQPGAVYEWNQTTGTTTLVQAGVITPASGVTLLGGGTVAAIRFSNRGYGYSPGTPGSPFSGTSVVGFCADATFEDNQRIVDLTAGSVISTEKTTGACS